MTSLSISKLIKRHRWLILNFCLYLLLVIWLFTTNPNSLPIVLLMVPGVLLFFSLFLSFRLLLGRFFPKQPASKRSLYAIYLSGLPSFLLLLSSVNQLTWRDFTLVLFLVICLWFYTGRINLAKS